MDRNSEYMSIQRTHRRYPWKKKMMEDTQWGVLSAVHNFSREVGAVLRVTYVHDCYGYPAWYIIKPPDYLGSDAPC
jgi:hypothetical protein